MKPPQTAEEYELYAVCSRLMGRHGPMFGEAAALIARHLRGENVDAIARTEWRFDDALDLKRAFDGVAPRQLQMLHRHETPQDS